MHQQPEHPESSELHSTFLERVEEANLIWDEYKYRTGNITCLAFTALRRVSGRIANLLSDRGLESILRRAFHSELASSCSCS
jgi:hypothetical protein